MLAAQTENVSGKVFNIGNGGSITVLDLVRDLNELLKVNIEPKLLPPRAGDVRHSQADISQRGATWGMRRPSPSGKGWRGRWRTIWRVGKGRANRENSLTRSTRPRRYNPSEIPRRVMAGVERGPRKDEPGTIPLGVELGAGMPCH